MKNKFSKFTFVLITIFFTTALSESLPAICGLKFPFVIVVGIFLGWPSALATGILIDSLDGLPIGCSATFLTAASLIPRSKNASIKILTAFLAASLFPIYLTLWGAYFNYQAYLLSPLIALIASISVYFIIPYAIEHCGLTNENESENNK